MKKLIAITMCCVIVLSAAACSAPADTIGAETAEPEVAVIDDAGELGGETVEVPNPFTDCADIAEAEKLAGFDMTLPEGIEAKLIAYRVIEGDMIEIIYFSGESSESEIMRFRKAKGTDDISGDYNKYTEASSIESENRHIDTRGKDGMVYAAVWSDNGYAYSMTFQGGASKSDVSAYAEAIR